jgi:alkylation response protein AidB-like acyl-CoA dehydrogenase
MGATSIVRDGSVARLDAGGAPVVRMMVVPRHECTVLDTWATTGMRGTASHDFTLEDVFVPEDYALDLAAPPTVANPMYTCPPLLFAPHGSHALGIARAALDAGIALAQGKTPFGGRTRLQDQATAQGQIGRAEALVEAARTFFYAALADLWASVAAGAGSSAAQRLRLRLACSHAAASAVQAVDLMYALGGGSAIYARSPLERQFRDIHTAAAHMYVNTATFEAAGRVVLGLEAGTRGF